MATDRAFADPIEMQNRLFAELSRMFGEEVPLYDRSLAVNLAVNRAVSDLVARSHIGFGVSDEQLEKTGGERHGAIRIGREDEYRWIGRFFACFGMEPHNFYDMTSVGAKSQPVIATAFRSVVHPEHRVFTSLLRTDSFDDETRDRVEGLLASREVFSDRARELVELSERDGGLSWGDAEALIREGVERIFRWTGEARDFGLYTRLSGSGLKNAADIACFGAHHLNHLTPNTLSMDLYTSSMKFLMGGIDEPTFKRRAWQALSRVALGADRDWIRLHFKHLSRAEIDSFERRPVGEKAVDEVLAALVRRFEEDTVFDLRGLDHSGFKATTEGPSEGVPVLLRQDAYRALTERVVFTEPDGSRVEATHTARFGEIEQRFYATTPEGRSLYDACLVRAEGILAEDPGLAERDDEAYRARYASCFEAFPSDLDTLLARGLVYGWYEPTGAGLARRGTVGETDLGALVREGLVARDGLRYEDFLPVSAAGIFASNLGDGGDAEESVSSVHTRESLESILGRPIVDSDSVYRGLQARSILDTYRALGLDSAIDSDERERLERDASSLPAGATDRFDERGLRAASV